MDLAFILFLDICSRLPLTAGTTLDCATMASVVERRRLLRNRNALFFLHSCLPHWQRLSEPNVVDIPSYMNTWPIDEILFFSMVITLAFSILSKRPTAPRLIFPLAIAIKRRFWSSSDVTLSKNFLAWFNSRMR
jgi:hypothetical protein